MALLWASRKLFSTQMLRLPLKINNSAFHTLRKSCRVLTETAPLNSRIHKRSYFWIFRRRTNRELRLIDNPPERYELVYRFPFENYFTSFQLISCIVLVGASYSFILRGNVENKEPMKKKFAIITDEIVPLDMAVPESHLMIMTTALILLVILTHMLISKIPLRIYYNHTPGKYMFYFNGIVPDRMKMLEVKAGEIIYKPKETSILPWRDDLYEYEPTGQQLILFEHHFKVPIDLSIMQGLVDDPNTEKGDFSSKPPPAKK